VVCNCKSICLGEHRTNIFRTALHTENTALLVTCVTVKSSQNELFVNQKCFKPVKALPCLCNIKKIALQMAWVLSPCPRAIIVLVVVIHVVLYVGGERDSLYCIFHTVLISCMILYSTIMCLIQQIQNI